MAAMSDTVTDTHFELGLAESAACEPTRWERWARAVESRLGHSLDGDQAADGYSLDWAYGQWLACEGILETVAAVKAAR